MNGAERDVAVVTGGAGAIRAAVADTEAVQDAIGMVAAEVVLVGRLLNAAGWDRFVPFMDTTQEIWERVSAINCRGTLNTVHAVLPGMIERSRGASWRSPGRSPTTGITVNVVCPGPHRHPLIRGMADELGTAVGPSMTTMAGEVADGVHVHPLHTGARSGAAAGARGAPAPRGRVEARMTSTC